MEMLSKIHTQWNNTLPPPLSSGDFQFVKVLQSTFPSNAIWTDFSNRIEGCSTDLAPPGNPPYTRGMSWGWWSLYCDLCVAAETVYGSHSRGQNQVHLTLNLRIYFGTFLTHLYLSLQYLSQWNNEASLFLLFVSLMDSYLIVFPDHTTG